MKKTYIEPKNTVVALRVCHNILQMSKTETMSKSGEDFTKDLPTDFKDWWNPEVNGEALGRETVSAPDAWDEW